MEFFGAARPVAGEGTVRLELADLRIELTGLDETLAGQLERRYRPYTAETTWAGPGLRVRVGREDRDYFIEPPPQAELNRVLLRCEGNRVRYVGYRVAGWFDVLDGKGDLLLARGTYEPAERAVENYVRAAVAWQAASRGGALIHAASAVYRDRGYLFYGESGAGKSTLAECDRRGRVVSDDLSLVLPGPRGGLDLVGSPFRGTYEGGAPVQGRFPLAAGFRILKGPKAEVRAVARSRALAELVGNLPFVAESFAVRPDLFARVEERFSTIPLSHLVFRKDDSYWDAVEAAGL
jgi:hypothetical protein